jgi:hypothetical protein
MTPTCFAFVLITAVVGVSGQMDAVDYADSAHVECWLRHPVYGDPSFDAFEREPGNPIHRGAPPFEWPVNGFLFADPRSGSRYVYVGLYAKGYAMGEGKGMGCIAYRSQDRGHSWENLGPIFPDEPFRFDGDEVAVGHAPDVSVVYANGRYHMVYDWATANSTWTTMMNPVDGADNGIGYAWADRPEGPFVRTGQPVYRTSAHPFYRGKYRRAYAATLIPREHDWLVLAMMDSGSHHAWALVGMTSERPEGPYSDPVFLRCVDDMYFHPPLLEFYPAFQHDGWIYAPATSVALNRNLQVVFRVKSEQAMDPGAWELFQYGSAWHAEPVPHEYHGIWGQTFSGFVDTDGVFHVMFPSLDEEGLGTINLASRPWDQRYRQSGFILSGHEGASLTLLKGSYSAFDLDCEMELRGGAAIMWGYHAPLGPNQPTSNSTLHPLSLTRYSGVELTGGEWRVVEVDGDGSRRVIASGDIDLSGTSRVALSHADKGPTHLSLNGEPLWSGNIEPVEGNIGILVRENSHLTVIRFIVKGTRKRGAWRYLHTEAIVGAGEAAGSWRAVEDSAFRYGVGALSERSDARGKWNFEGSGFSLWAPKRPEYVTADVFLDGVELATIDFGARQEEPSTALLSRNGLHRTYHALVVQAKEGTIPLDVLEVVE